MSCGAEYALLYRGPVHARVSGVSERFLLYDFCYAMQPRRPLKDAATENSVATRRAAGGRGVAVAVVVSVAFNSKEGQEDLVSHVTP